MTRRFVLALALAIGPTLVDAARTPVQSAGTACSNLAALTLPGIRVRAAPAVARARYAAWRAGDVVPAFCRRSGRGRPATPRSNSKSDSAVRRVERQVRRRRQRRLLGDRLRRWPRTAPRLRDREHRHRTRRRRHEVRPGPSGENRRLGAPRGARHDGGVEVDRPRSHRPLPRARLLQRLLERWSSGVVRGAALPRRLRRHHRRRSGAQPHPPDVRLPAFVDRHAPERRRADRAGGETGDAD